VIARFRARVGSSYRLRLTLGYVAIIAVLAAAWLATLFGPLTAAVTGQQRAHLGSVARADAVALEHDDGDAQGFVRSVGTRDLRVTVVSGDGKVLADNQNDPSAMENHRGRPEVAAALAGKLGTDVRRSRTEGVQQMYVAVPASYRGQPVALRVSESLTTVGALAASARTTGLLALALAVGISLFVTARLSSSAAAPVSRLADAARAMARGDLRTRVPAEPGDLGVLSEALEDLAEQVRARIDDAAAEQENLRSVLDGLDDAVLLLEDGVVQLTNRSASRLFRRPAGGWQGKRLEDAGLPASLASAIREGGGGARELGPDATGRTLRLTLTPLGDEGARRRTLVVVSDVSERARLDAMRRDFVANASHELKTPTSAIQLLADSAAAAASDGDVEQSLAFVGQMRDEADRLRRLVLELLDLSRLEQVPGAAALTDARAAVELALAAHRASAEAKGLALRADFSAVEDEDAFVAADATDVAIALDNLLSNAVAYTDAGEVVVSVAATAERVELAVADTGCGIPADDLPRVFERFYRVDRARSRERGGTGLGLSLVRHAAERAGGDVRITSQPGAGTRVTLTLPRAA
jgi:two-component system phosphate regulon sensor histidine kinase PhoR